MTFFGLGEGTIRLTVFATVFIIMALTETVFPRKIRTQPRQHRWFTNWTLVILNTLALRICVPILAVGMALHAEEQGWGLLSLIALPAWIEITLAVILLDMAVYAQHVASHKIPILWRFHKVHHVDRDIDVTTGSRFHPVEIVVSMVYKLACVAVIGPAAFAVFIFEVILNASAMFNHSNVKLPLGFDRVMRMLVVTPDVHRVHHSIIQQETDSNYGFFLSIWDRMFRTYKSQPAHGHDGIVIGLREYQTDQPSSLLWSLLLPFGASTRQSVGNTKTENG